VGKSIRENTDGVGFYDRGRFLMGKQGFGMKIAAKKGLEISGESGDNG
jgi:hypothetical protein